MAWQWSGDAGGGKGRCVGSLWVTIGHLRVILSLSKHKANTTELHPKVRQTCVYLWWTYILFFTSYYHELNEHPRFDSIFGPWANGTSDSSVTWIGHLKMWTLNKSPPISILFLWPSAALVSFERRVDASWPWSLDAGEINVMLYSRGEYSSI